MDVSHHKYIMSVSLLENFQLITQSASILPIRDGKTSSKTQSMKQSQMRGEPWSWPLCVDNHFTSPKTSVDIHLFFQLKLCIGFLRFPFRSYVLQSYMACNLTWVELWCTFMLESISLFIVGVCLFLKKKSVYKENKIK